jgi:steroid 5-alpha reductase family enzyme
MQMIKTASLLIVTLLLIPILCFKFGQPLDAIQMHMVKTAAIVMLCFAGACFLLSELTGNCSQFDKLWSILPMVYAWQFAWQSGWNERIVLMAILSTIWGIRLTYNFARRGGYSWKFWEGEEDYRWEVLRLRKEFQNKWVWRLFNLFFISFYQNTLVLLFTLPPVIAFQVKDKSLTATDGLFACLFIGLVILETIADQQQWRFQKSKYGKLKTGEPLSQEEAQGFLNTGLWAIVRHPNYSAEQAIWICFYLLAAVASGNYVNWSIAGCILLMLLFWGSSNFSEEISAGKYSGYKAYQQSTPRFLPKLLRK